ncbi:MAG: NAD(P)/FAD-dependent oxidoreductase [candidate division Zixibacteria bacterium]|nr:NAD(P)/FAD-dependent oxidoreductase [candidate division Zixibacteria bacterium]
MRIAIIGGGAAGFFGAIAAATHDSSAEIVILESTKQPLAKVRVSGGGRCNVTHHCFDPAELVENYPRGNRELLGPFHRFQPRDTVAWFAGHGVQLKVEADGRMFPVTDQSSTIVDCLLNASAQSGVQVRLDAKVKSAGTFFHNGDSRQFEIEFGCGIRERYDRVLLATGGNPHGHLFAEALGHSIVPCVSSLFTFKVTDARLRGLAGTSFNNVRISLKGKDKRKIEQTGALLITHWGLSGPAVLKLSAWGARILADNDYQAELTVDFLPQHSEQELYRTLLAHKEQNGRKHIKNTAVFPVPNRYWHRIVQYIGTTEETRWSSVTKEAMKSIASELTRGRFAIVGKGIFKEEFVTCGGVNLREVDFKTMQSKLCPGLFFAGEILDIDGITGGFNFQNAWTTGWVAGKSMVA